MNATRNKKVSHTPEPWHWFDHGDSSGQVQAPSPGNPDHWLEIAYVGNGKINPGKRANCANGILLASAPALLSALRGMVEMFRAVSKGIPWGDTILDVDAIAQMNDAEIAAVKAIAKAEGRD